MNAPATRRLKSLQCVLISLAAGWLAPTATRAADAADAASGVWVDGKDRATVAFAYLNSPTFRAEFDRARANPNIAVRLSTVPAQWLDGLSVLGLTRWLELPEVRRYGPRGVFRGVIVSRARIGPLREVAGRLAHELAHVNELARYGDIRNARGYRVSRSDPKFAETEPALAIGEQVRAELQAAPVRRLEEFEIVAVLGPARPAQPEAALVAAFDAPPAEDTAPQEVTASDLASQ